jgi:guanylate kinase
METVNRGHLVLLMAPSGSGKSALLSHLRAQVPNLHFAVSCTTRAMRPGERDGDVYHFVSDAQFDAYVEEGRFLEWAVYSNNKYGTLRSEIIDRMNKGEVVIREVELQGIESILKLLPRERITVLYIDGGDWETLKARIQKRAPISDEELLLRYERYMHETEAKHIADIVIENTEGNIDTAQEKIIEILKSIIEANESYA